MGVERGVGWVKRDGGGVVKEGWGWRGGWGG